MSKKKTTEIFITEAIKISPDYNYSKANYINAHTKVEIICKEHNSFFMSPRKLLDGQKCKKCVGTYSPSTEEFVEKAKLISPKYDYSQTEYVNNRTEIKVICPEHYLFLITPKALLKGQGCSKCYGKYKSNTEEFIVKAKIIFPNYIYKDVDYQGSKIKVKIWCDIEEHGSFQITPNDLLNGHGCSKCYGNYSLSKEEFLQSCYNKNINYRFDRIKYINMNTPIEVGCNIIEHGYFFIAPNRLLKHQGCWKCAQGFGEKFTRIVFESLFEIKFIKIRPDWLMRILGDKRTKLELDGYAFIKYLNYAIAFEYQGRQHQEIIPHFLKAAKKSLERQQPGFLRFPIF